MMEFNNDIEWCFNVEKDWMPAEGYAESKSVVLRKVAMREMVRYAEKDQFTALVRSLAMNIFDRFISRNELPNVLGQAREDIILLANACLLLAWFGTEVYVRYEDFLDKRNLHNRFRSPLVNMEYRIRHALKGQMDTVVSPLSFIKFLAKKAPVGEGIELRTLHKIIVYTQGDINFTRFKYSVIAASALLTACRILYKDQYDTNKQIFLASRCVEEEDLDVCIEKTYEMCINMKLVLEKVEGFNLHKSEPGETSSQISQRPGKEPMQEKSEEKPKPPLKSKPQQKMQHGGTSQSRDVSSMVSDLPGKKPTQEEIQEEPRSLRNQRFKFEVKWMLWISEDPREWIIDSPLLQFPRSGKLMKFNNDIEWCFNVEKDWMPAEGYEEGKSVVLRKVAMREMVRYSEKDQLTALVRSLAMNIFDRFISRIELPHVLGQVRDDIILLANACLMIAWFGTEVNVRYEDFVDKRDLHRRFMIPLVDMELSIRRALKDQMDTVVSPLSFIKFLAKKVPVGEGIELSTLYKIIVYTQGEISFTRFKYSVIAASALLTACRILYSDQYDMNRQILLASRCVEEEDLDVCIEKTYEMCINLKLVLERVEGFNLQKSGPGETSSQITQRPGKEPMDENSEEKPKLIMKSEPQQKLQLGVTSQSTDISSMVSDWPGKKPTQEEIQEEEPRSLRDQRFNFEVNWMLWISEDPIEWIIDSPAFRSAGSGTLYMVAEPSSYLQVCGLCSCCPIT